jgi:hypothetical protein
LAEVLEFGERAVLDWRIRSPEVVLAPDLVERVGGLAVEAVAQLERPSLAVAELRERAGERLAGERVDGALVKRFGVCVDDQPSSDSSSAPVGS